MEKRNIFDFSVKQIKPSGVFSGYASVFNVADEQGDVILPESFNLTKENIPILWQHKIDEPIGKTVRLQQNDNGLYIHAVLIVDIKRGYEAYKLLDNQVINGLSIGYIPKKYTIDRENGYRVITSIDLVEISLVTFPANSSARVNCVNKDGDFDSTLIKVNDLVTLLRN